MNAIIKQIKHADDMIFMYQQMKERLKTQLNGTITEDYKVMTIIEIVQAEYNIKDIQAKKGKGASSDARGVAMWLIKEHTNLSLSSIGKYFSLKDHASVIHQIDKVKGFRFSEREFKTRTDYLNKVCKNELNAIS